MSEKRCPGCMSLLDSLFCPNCGWKDGNDNEAAFLHVETVLADKYLVGRVLEVSDFGVTYLGYDREKDKKVHIEELFPVSFCTRNDSGAVLPQQEQAPLFGELLRRFQGAGIVNGRIREKAAFNAAYDCFNANDTAYMVYPQLPGVSLGQFIQRRGKMEAEEILRLLRGVITELNEAHSQGCLHGAIDPDAIVLHPMEGPKLRGFGKVGIASAMGAQHSGCFVPAERVDMKLGLGPWTDVYGLSATLYFCLTGAAPQGGKGAPDWSGAPHVSETVRSAITAGMAYDPKNRPQDLQTLMDMLSGKIPVQQQKKSGNTTGKKKRWILPVAIGAAVLVVAGIAAALLLKPSGPDVRPEEEPAEISAPWVENVLKYDPLSDLDIGRAKIHSVTFLSTLDEAPEDAVDLSESGDGNVLGWVIGNSVYIAAEEGINGKVSCESLFEDCIALETVSFGDSFFTAETTSMESMFRGCIKLSQVDAENLDTGNVTTMKYMFFGWYDADDNTYWTDNEVSVLRHLDVSTWDVSRVEDMSFMFRYCNSMTRLDLSGWDTSSVVTMEDMFGCCTNLTDLNVSTWDVSAVEDMNQMFVACESLETLDVSDWDVSAVEDMTLMFFNCPKLTVDVSGWDVSSVTEFDRFMPDDKKVNGEPWENLFK